MNFIGIDGCKAGWFFVGLDARGDASFGIFRHIDELAECFADTSMVLIDIPIGLRGRQSEPRLCDTQARAVLAPGRKSSVFPAPCRAALEAKSYAEANDLNKAETGKGLPAQCYGIVPKIREVDGFMRSHQWRNKLREMHPEVALWALNHRKPMQYSKKSSEGFAERMTVLAWHYSDPGRVVELAMQQHKRKEVARDDIVDALVGVVTARYFRSLESFPSHPEMDDMGLPMEIVYWRG